MAKRKPKLLRPASTADLLTFEAVERGRKALTSLPTRPVRPLFQSFLLSQLTAFDLKDVQGRYENSIWAYAAINVVIREAMRIAPPKAFLKRGDELVPWESPLLENPTFSPDGTVIEDGQMFVGLGYANLETMGNVYIYRIMKSGMPIYMQRLDPRRVSIVGDRVKKVAGYLYESLSGTRYRLEPWEVVHIKLPNNPFSEYFGLSQLEIAQLTLKGDIYMREWNESFWKRGGVVGGTLTTEAELDENQRAQLKAEFSNLYGDPTRAGRSFRVALLEQGMKFDPISLNQKQMELIATLNQNVKDIVGLFGVPMMLLNLGEETTKAHALEETRNFQRNKMLPYHRLWEKGMNQVFREMGDVRIQFDLSTISELSESIEEIAAVADQLIRNMIVTPNWLAKKLNAPEHELGSGFFIPFTSEFVESQEILPSGEKSLHQPPTGGGDGPSLKRDPEIPPLPTPKNSDIRRGALPSKTESPHLIRSSKRRVRPFRAFMARVEPREDRFAGKVSRFMQGQQKSVVSNLRRSIGGKGLKQEGDELDALIRMILWDEVGAKAGLSEVYTTEISSSLREEAAYLITKLGFRGDEFDVLLPHVQRWIENKVLKGVPSVIETLTGQFRNTLSEGLNAGESIGQLSDRILDVFGPYVDDKAWAARRIVRTEVIGASNAGAWFGANETGGAVEGKEWMVADQEARHPPDSLFDHLGANGERVDLNETFMRTGEPLMFPGDPSGSPGNVINCRCGWLPITALSGG